MRIKESVNCTFANGVSVPICRSQVHVLPNFAITVYSSQDKTRPTNVMILNSCRDHLSYYTALSRSSTAEGTVIIQGFNPSKITCGAYGSLRQEFRELELMDEITQLKFCDKLPLSINDHVRNALIRQYQMLKGESYVPKIVPDQLKWSKTDPMNILKVQTDTPWQLIEKLKEKLTKYTPASGTVALDNTNLLKRKADDDQISSPKNKRPKTKLDVEIQNENPVGLIWDSNNYSCAYDSVFTVLGDIWVYDPTMWSREFGLTSSFASKLALGFQKVSAKEKNLEDIRNIVRKFLNRKDPAAFPYGTSGVDISDLLLYIFASKGIGKILYNCTNCGASTTSAIKVTTLFTISVKKYPSIIRGAIYYGGAHFVSRIISPTGEVWYHDGIETKRQSFREGHLIDFSEESLIYRGNKVCVSVIYAV